MRVMPTVKTARSMIPMLHGKDKIYMLTLFGPEAVENEAVLEIAVITDSSVSTENFKLNRRSISTMRDWAERTIYMLDHPDRYFEETKWRKYSRFWIPQRVGFDVFFHEECNLCWDECTRTDCMSIEEKLTC